MNNSQQDIVVAFDTANETIAIGVGVLHAAGRTISLLASVEAEARRASNTQLLPRIDTLLAQQGIARERIACVVCGRGPGSFTGVRICMATAKGMASALEVALWGVSTTDAIAWNLWDHAVRGEV
ncbi:MAG: tRNA (adenosine(37)-N6)-threonylcarbamoyltransferase complex dimerization subunit type 1 TsaB, partial [Raoultibacter sp.]